MKSNPYRSHSAAAAITATLVTTVLVASLVQSFEPSQLLRFEDANKAQPIVAQARRSDSAADWS